MRTILIILSALGAAILALNLLKLAKRLAEERGETVPDRISAIHMISALVGWRCFSLVRCGESNSAPPGSVYAPATIEDGTLKSGGFDTQK